MLSPLFYPGGKEKACRKALGDILTCTHSCGVSECQTLVGTSRQHHHNLPYKLSWRSAAAGRRMSMVPPSPQDCTASQMPSIKQGQSHDLLLQYLTSVYSLPNWEYC